MEIIGFIFGMTGLAMGILAYFRVDKLEKKLKETGIVDKDFSSGAELP